MGHAVLDAGLGDLIKGDPVLVFEIQVQQVGQMPGDGLPFPVGVGGQIDFVALLGLFDQGGDQIFLAFDVDILGGETVFDIHPYFAFGQVADVAHGGHHLIIIAQIFLDGFRLGRRLHNH